jgi:hypothetical protein
MTDKIKRTKVASKKVETVTPIEKVIKEPIAKAAAVEEPVKTAAVVEETESFSIASSDDDEQSFSTLALPISGIAGRTRAEHLRLYNQGAI